MSLEIEDFVDHLIRIGVLDAVGEKTVMWDDLNEQTSSEKLDSAEKMSRINQTSLAMGEEVFAPDEIRTAAGYDPADDRAPLPDEDDDEEETKATDPTS